MLVRLGQPQQALFALRGYFQPGGQTHRDLKAKSVVSRRWAPDPLNIEIKSKL